MRASSSKQWSLNTAAPPQNRPDVASTAALTHSSTSATRHTTCGGRSAATSPPPAAARWPCGRYTTRLPRRGSATTGPAHACHSSRLTAGVGRRSWPSPSTMLRSIPMGRATTTRVPVRVPAPRSRTSRLKGGADRDPAGRRRGGGGEGRGG
jgi:hypothetical protein